MAEFVIAGPGAVGVALGSELLRAGHGVRYWGRQGPMAVKAQVSQAEGPLAEAATVGCPEWDQSYQPQAVFFCVKANQLGEALVSVDQFTPEETPFIVLCNGIVEGVIQEWATKRVGAQKASRLVRIGTSTVGVTEKLPGPLGARSVVVHSQSGCWTWGPLLPEVLPAQPWEQELFAHQRFAWAPDARRLVQFKWLVNTVVNTLAGAYQLPRNGDLTRMGERLDLVLAEALQLGRELWGPWDKDDAELRQLIGAVIADTAENENSMARDVRLGRVTESPWLAGLAADRPGYPLLKDLHHRIMSGGAGAATC